MNEQKQTVLMISSDGSFEFLLPLSIFELEQIRDRMTQHIEAAKRQTRFSPQEAIVSENGSEA